MSIDPSHCHCAVGNFPFHHIGYMHGGLQVAEGAGLTPWVALFGTIVGPEVIIAPGDSLDGSGAGL